MRTDITCHSGDDRCAGWLYRSEGFEGPRPLMVMAAGEVFLGGSADRLQHRGMAGLHRRRRHGRRIAHRVVRVDLGLPERSTAHHPGRLHDQASVLYSSDEEMRFSYEHAVP
jgi:hypothetical protein